MRGKSNLCISRNELFFMIGISCEIIAMQVNLTTIPYMVNAQVCNAFLKLLRYVGYFFVLLKIGHDDYKWKECIAIACICMLLAINSIQSGRILFLTFFFVYGMKNLKFDRIAWIMLAWSAIIFVSIVFSSQIGLIENWDYIQGDRIRYSLGYFYPSHCTSAVFYIILMFCYLMKDRLKVWQMLALLIIDIWQYRITDSRAGSVLIALLLISFYLWKYIKPGIIRKIVELGLKSVFPVCAGISIIGCLLYGKIPILTYVNLVLNNRLRLGQDAIYKYGIQLLGKEISWTGNGGLGHVVEKLESVYDYVDCSYIKLLLEAGLLVWSVIMIGFTLASIKAVNEKNYYLALALAFVAAYCIIEPRLMELGFNPFILTLVVLINGKKSVLEQQALFPRRNLARSHYPSL